VARLMRSAGLKGCPKRVLSGHDKTGLAPAWNLLDQDFSAAQINERRASDGQKELFAVPYDAQKEARRSGFLMLSY